MKKEPIFKIEEYEGPIHLLLEMFKSSKLEITLLNIDVILEQYLDYINECKENDILLAANYLDLAAEIVLYKSKKILKLDVEDEEDEEVLLDKEELVNKILEYKSYKEASKEMDVLKSQRELYLTKQEENLEHFMEENLKPISYEKFYNTIATLLIDIKKNTKEEKVIVKKDLNISDYVDKIIKKERIDLSTFFLDLSRKEKVIYFLALLIVLKKDEFKIYEMGDNKIVIKGPIEV